MKKKKTTIEGLAILVVNGFDEVKGELTEVKGELTEVKGELTEVKGELVKVKNGLSGVKGEVSNLKTRMASVEYGQYEIQKKLDGVASNYDLAKMDSKYERRFQKIETKIGIKQKTH